MLLLLALAACTNDPVDTNTGTDDTADTSGETGDSADTGDTGSGPDLGVLFTQNQPGPYTQLCDESFQDTFLRSKNPDLYHYGNTPEGWALFNHSAQVLQAKLDSFSAAANDPTLPEVCQDLADALVGLPGPVPIINDCPNLIPDTGSDVSNAIPLSPYDLQQYYEIDSVNDRVHHVAFPNIAFEHPDYIGSEFPAVHTMPQAMNEVEAVNGNPPGCWLKFNLRGDAASDPNDLTVNSMPIVLFTNHAYQTASVLAANHADGSLVISGADITVPTPVATFLWGSPPPSPAPMPYAELYLSAGYPPDATFLMQLNTLDYSIMGTMNMDAPADTMPDLQGWGIIDPESEKDLRELDWAITEHLWVDRDKTGSAPLTYDPIYDTGTRGTGMPKLWPAEPDPN